MFIINITYKTSIDKIEASLKEHIDFLNEQYEKGNFLASGRKIPRTGGIILSSIPDKEKLIEILNKDPFKSKELANYEIIEFIPSKTSKELNFLKP